MILNPEQPPLYHWIAKSGKSYPYRVFEYGMLVPNDPGNFIVCDQATPLQVIPMHIGQGNNVAYEMLKYEASGWFTGRKHAHAYVHVRVNEFEADRLAEEKDLKELYQPRSSRRPRF